MGKVQDAASFQVITDADANTVKLQAQGPLDIEEKCLRTQTR